MLRGKKEDNQTSRYIPININAFFEGALLRNTYFRFVQYIIKNFRTLIIHCYMNIMRVKIGIIGIIKILKG